MSPEPAIREEPGVESLLETDPVADFYTRHPYPPPVENLARARDEWRDGTRERAEFHLYWPAERFRRELDILVAGCGTWQAAKYALCRPGARVVGIDVSATSIEHTQNLARKYSLDNLEIEQIPLERVGELGRRFDLVVCTGVLHHLADPEAGLRALAQALKPAGAMNLMVYAPHGRAGVYLLQEFCRRIGIGTSDREIDELVETLSYLPRQHPLAATLRAARDATNADALADALLNPRDRAYTVPQLFDLLDCGGLAFARWYAQAPYLPRCGSIATTPHAARLSELPAREQYAAMELWRGVMTCHSVVAHRRDARWQDADIHFDEPVWKNFVPHRLPWTKVVTERVPAGAAAVLLNQSHAFEDLFLVLRRIDRKMFERIDGRRSIAQIAAEADAHDVGRARELFESLWRHDHVVFER